MLGGGGVDGAIHRAAGRDLYEACGEVEEVEPGVRCPTGEARITPCASASRALPHVPAAMKIRGLSAAQAQTASSVWERL